MQEILNNVSWLAVIVGSVVAYVLGALWYSSYMFGEKWKQGIGTPATPNRPMMPLMVGQFVATVLFAWALVVSLQHSMALAVLVTLAVSALVKTNSLFGGKSYTAVAVEALYILAQAAVIIVAAKIISSN